jgi:hypothetical protein
MQRFPDSRIALRYLLPFGIREHIGALKNWVIPFTTQASSKNLEIGYGILKILPEWMLRIPSESLENLCGLIRISMAVLKSGC